MAATAAPFIRNQTQSVKSKHRPEIDGLRAFAVVAVIINHFSKVLLPSGYLGVDIFFVISGYVITSSLADRKSKNFLDFVAGFYERRIKRLVPALVVFALITSLLICLFNPDPSVALKTGVNSLYGLSNLYLFRQSIDYFAQTTELNPFTHTWSLGVEEQFYFLFPFLIWFSGFGQQKVNGARNLFFWVGTLTIASLVSFIYLYQVNQPAAYFLMPPRFWEMAAGCMIFIGFQKRARIEQALEEVPPLAVVLAMVGVMFLPVSAAVPATIGIVMLSAILIACLKKGTFAYHLFTLEKVVFVGLISYSLYLWHWTVLSISRWTIGIHWWSVPIQVFVILCASALSFKYIEKPFRSISKSGRRIILPAGFASICAISVIALFLNSRAAQLFQLANPQIRLVEQLLNNGKIYKSWVIKEEHSVGGNEQAFRITETKGCHKSDLIKRSDVVECLGMKSDNFSKRSRIYIFGDSHAAAIAPAISSAFPHSAVRYYTAGWGCGYLSTAAAEKMSRINNFNCSSYVSNVDSFVDNGVRPGDLVILSMDWRDEGAKKESPNLDDAIALLAKRVAAKDASFALLDDVPAVGEPLLCQKTWYRPFPPAICIKTIQQVKEDQRLLDAIGEELVGLRRKNIKYINIRQEFCERKISCSIYLGNLWATGV